MQPEKKIRTLFQSTTDVFFSIDAVNQKTLFISETCKNMFGYSSNEFYKNFNLFSEIFHPDDKKKFIRSITNHNSTRTVILQCKISDADIAPKWVQCRTKPVVDNSGLLIKTEGVFEDISEQKKIELNYENKIKDLNFYIYRITHDLRGPISSALGLVYIAKREAHHEPLITYLNKIEESNKKLDSILLNLVDVIRTLSNTPISKELINFETLINEILKGFEHSPKRIGVDITTSIDPHIEYFSDRRLIISVLFNLIQNSINYNYKTSDAFISIKVKLINKAVHIFVEDNGDGIADEMKSKIFDMFFRGNEDSKGSGLGLYIVKNAVEKLKGTIELQSTLKKGTCFHLILPL